VARHRDPITLLGGWLTEQGIAAEAELQRHDDDVRRLVDDGLAFALDAPFPDVSEVDRHVSSPETAKTREITFGKAINEALAEELRRDDRVFVIGEDVAEAGTPFKVLSGLVDEFRHRSSDRLADLGSRRHRPVCGRCHDRHAAGRRHHVR